MKVTFHFFIIYRTLINQLVSSLLVRSIIFSFTVEVLDIAFYIIGPFPLLLCYLELFLRSSLTMQGILYLDSIFIIRYLFVFHMKNPTATQDDFWIRFLNIWTSGNFLLQYSIFTLMVFYYLRKYFSKM